MEFAFDKSSSSTSCPDFSIFNRNFVILKKFESNVLYVAKITLDKTDFFIDINLLCLDESKKAMNVPSIEKEKLLLRRNFNLETFIFDFHLEMAFKIYKENFDFYIDVNYLHFLGFLANNYRYLNSSEFYLNAAIISYFPRSIKPKTSRDFEDFLKDHASAYHFFCKEIRGVRSLMFYTALDYFQFQEVEDYDFIIAFDFLDPEQRKLYGAIENIVIGDIENSEGEEIHLVLVFLFRSKLEKNKLKEIYSEFIEIFKKILLEQFELMERNMLSKYFCQQILSSEDKTLKMNEFKSLLHFSPPQTLKKEDDFFLKEIFNLPIFNEKFHDFLLKNHNIVKFSQTSKGEVVAFVPNRDLTSAMVIEIAPEQTIANIFAINLKESERNHEKLLESSLKTIETNTSLLRREEEFKDHFLTELFRYAFHYNLCP